MEAELVTIATWLQSTLLPDQQARQAAEEALKQAEAQPGCAVLLFRLAVDQSLTQVEPALRQAAAIHMKNLIVRRWERREPNKFMNNRFASNEPPAEPLADADKAVVRSNLMEAIIVSPSVVRSQLGLCLRTIVQADYPAAWPELLPSICNGMTSPEPARLRGALFALRVLAKVYEFRREQARGPSHVIADATFPTLIAMAQAMVQAPPAVDTAELALLVAKVFWSCTQLGLPPWLLVPGQLQAWFDTLLAMLEQPLPEGRPSDEEDDAKWPPFKVKKRVASIFHRILQRYGNPNRKIEGDNAQELLGFARYYQDTCSPRCLATTLSMLKLQGPARMPGRVTTLCIQYVEECLQYKLTYAALKPQLGDIFSHIILPALAFSDGDAELWDDDPHEFVRKSFDLIEDYYSSRTAAINLLSSLVKQRPKDCLHGVVTTCSALLSRTLGSTDVGAQRERDGALLAIGSLHEKLAKKEAYKASLEPMLQTHVWPELASPQGFLRLRACWTYGQFAQSLYCRQKGQPADAGHETAAAVYHQMLVCMSDTQLPVRTQAALTIHSLVNTGSLSPQAVLESLPKLLELLFALLREVSNDEVVATLDTLIEKYGDHMAPYAHQVVSALASIFLRLVNEADDEDEGDSSTLAAMGVMQALVTMMEALHSHVELYEAMVPPLLPVLARCTKEDAEDFFEDALELLSYLTYYPPTIPAPLWDLLPALHEAFHLWASDYMGNLLGPLDNYISRGTETFLTAQNGAYVGMVLSVCRATLINPQTSIEQQDARDVRGALKVLEAILNNCRGRVDSVLSEILQMLLQRLVGAPANIGALLYTLLAAALFYNPALTLMVLEHRQVTMPTLQEWAAHLRTSEKLTAHDMKLASLGVSSLLALPDASLPPLVAQNRLLLLRLGLMLQQKLTTQRAKEAADEEEDEEEDDDDDDDDDDDAGLADDVDGCDEGHDDHATLRRLLRTDKTFNLEDFLRGGSGEGDDESAFSDEEGTSPIDDFDEHIHFKDALQLASTHDALLLQRAGLEAPTGAEGVPQLTAEETAALKVCIEAGVAKQQQQQQQQQQQLQ